MLKSLSESDFGNYKCLASNEVASSSIIFTVKSNFSKKLICLKFKLFI